jgi:ubiquinone/menaquinone biosynthesis C-methylase UbiE
VISCGVLEHVREGGGDELKSLLEIKRILKPGGYFVCVAFPNRFSYIHNLNVLLFGWKFRKIPYTVKYHKYVYSKKEVLELCRAAGMEVVDYRKYAFLPRNGFRRFPESMRRSKRVADAINTLDGILAGIFSLFCTSHLFVLKK